jgi:hypothetical protein
VDASFDRQGHTEDAVSYAIVGSNYTAWQVNLKAHRGRVIESVARDLADLPATFKRTRRRSTV